MGGRSAAPTGGNYWSNWTGPDDDADGFVDSPYVITLYYNLDNLPWTQQDGWIVSQPPTADSLLETIGDMYAEGLIDNAGIANSLASKLDAAIKKIEQGKVETAKNILEALINQISAQSGKHISAEVAEALIADIEYILDSL